MLGFSLPKLIVLAVIIAAVWYGFKLFNRGGQATARSTRVEDDAETQAAPSVDMNKCPVCDIYISADEKKSCGRGDCPYPGG